MFSNLQSAVAVMHALNVSKHSVELAFAISSRCFLLMWTIESVKFLQIYYFRKIMRTCLKLILSERMKIWCLSDFKSKLIEIVPVSKNRIAGWIKKVYEFIYDEH